jgi:hypothetical protein
MHILKRWEMLVLLTVIMVRPAAAQKINFGAYTTSQGLTLTVNGGLNFGNIITNGPAVTIGLYDNCGYVQIVGDATRDITIVFQTTTNLSYGANQIPFTCQFAYSNTGATDVNTAKANATVLPSGYTAITLPMLQRSGGVPAPPPTPAHGGYTAPSATAFLFLYGTLGPISSVPSGTYTGMVNVYVDYTTY